jgi:hypothetical protein
MKEHEEIATWWKLAIEMIVDEKQSEWRGMYPEIVAGEIYARYYSLGIPPFEELVGACENYLLHYKDHLPGKGCLPFDDHDWSDRSWNDICSDLNAKSCLLKAHVAKIEAYIEHTNQHSEDMRNFE